MGREIIQIIIGIALVAWFVPSSKATMKKRSSTFITDNPQTWSAIVLGGSILGVLIGVMFLLAVSGICPSSGSIGSNVSCVVGGNLLESLAQWGYLLVLMSGFLFLTPVFIWIWLIASTAMYRYKKFTIQQDKSVIIHIGLILCVISAILVCMNIVFVIIGL